MSFRNSEYADTAAEVFELPFGYESQWECAAVLLADAEVVKRLEIGASDVYVAHHPKLGRFKLVLQSSEDKALTLTEHANNPECYCKAA